MISDFYISAFTFTLVMFGFLLFKDVYLQHQYRKEHWDYVSKKLNQRWIISLIFGIAFLLLVYGCTPEIDVCSKQSKSDNIVVCTKIYQPVRAPDGTIYGNSCMAEADGWDNGCLTLVNNI